MYGSVIKLEPEKTCILTNMARTEHLQRLIGFPECEVSINRDGILEHPNPRF